MKLIHYDTCFSLIIVCQIHIVTEMWIDWTPRFSLKFISTLDVSYKEKRSARTSTIRHSPSLFPFLFPSPLYTRRPTGQQTASERWKRIGETCWHLIISVIYADPCPCIIDVVPDVWLLEMYWLMYAWVCLCLAIGSLVRWVLAH